MADFDVLSERTPPNHQGPRIVIQNVIPKESRFLRRVVTGLFIISLIANFIFLGMFAESSAGSAQEQFMAGDRTAEEKIAVIKVRGFISSETIASACKEFKAAAKDEDVKAVVMSVDSPGGTIAGSDELYHEVTKYKEETSKPLVVAMRGMGTSGAYYISMPADRIFAQQTCVTGSIGVISSFLNFEKLLNDWGVVSEVVKSGAMKDSGSPFRAMTEQERAEWQQLIDQMFAQFLKVVLDHRSDEIGGEEKLRQLADGRVFLAAEALKEGLIDELGYEEDAIEHAKQLAGLQGKKVRIITYARPLGGWLDIFSASASATPRPAIDLDRIIDLQVPRLYMLPGRNFITSD
jgi:protease-4